MSRRLIGFWVVTITVSMIAGCGTKQSTHRSDEFLIANFRNHRAEFNTLLEMFRADRGLIYFARDHTIPEDPQSIGLSAERLEEYRQLFSTAGVEGLAAADRLTGAKDEIWFFTSIQGSRPSTFKHYAYVSKPARGIIQDLDKDGSKASPYRHIESRWYLALDDAD